MENASKALIIVGSLLISVAILSLLVYTFSGIGGTEKRKDDQAESKSLMDFNAEYEAFNKKLMYGVDVISCINKAVSNNETAIDKKDIDALVNVKVGLNSDSSLTEELRIYRKKGNFLEKIFKPGTSSSLTRTETNIKNDIQNLSNKKIKDLFTSIDWSKRKVLTGFGENDKILSLVGDQYFSTNTNISISKDDDQILKDDGKKINTSSALLKLSYTQSEYTEDIDFNVGTTNNYEYCIKWTTIISSFKKKTFRCEKIEYNDNNGRVKCITFQER